MAARSRNFCFTLNNYSEDVYQSLLRTECKYIVIGKEVGASGTPHLQGYVSFKDPRTLNTLKKLDASAHWEICKGLPSQNRAYCIKEGNFEEVGTLPIDPTCKGKMEQVAWAEALLAVQENRLEDIRPDILCRSLKQIEYAAERIKASKRSLETFTGEMRHEWYYGKSGTGKSRKAREENPGAYIKDPETKWWHGYAGEEVAIIDDFDKFQIKMGGYIKRWSDRYAFTAESKGGQIMIPPLKIIITSQYRPEQIWDDPETLDAIKRRFKLTHFDAGMERQTFMEANGW